MPEVKSQREHGHLFASEFEISAQIAEEFAYGNVTYNFTYVKPNEQYVKMSSKGLGYMDGYYYAQFWCTALAPDEL